MQEIKAKIEFISSIHVGSGEVITPLDYFIKDGKLHKLNFNKFISTFSENERENLLDVLSRNDFVKLRTFAEEHCKQEAIEYSIPVSSEVIQEYDKKRTDPKNRLEVSVFPFDGVMRHPYIPGSSLKGALRTALLESFLEKEAETTVMAWIKQTERDRTGNQFEGKILGYERDIHRDIFRVLKVFDVPLKLEDTEIVSCINFSPKRKSNIPMHLQVTKSKLSDVGKKYEKEFTIVWDEELKEAKVQNGKELFQKKFSLEELGSACNAHYFKVLFWEYEKFYKENPELIFNILKNLHKNLGENQFLIRLGRFGHVESKTFDKYRRPKSKKGWGRTRTKAQEYPLGWAIITIPNKKFTKPTEEELKAWQPTGENHDQNKQQSSSSHQAKTQPNPNQSSSQKKNSPKQSEGYNPFKIYFKKGEKK